MEKYAEILDEISLSEEIDNDNSIGNSNLSNTRFLNIKKDNRNSNSKQTMDDEKGR